MDFVERPCFKCGIPLKKGVRIVIVLDVISGCALTILWSMVLNHFIQHPYEHIAKPQPAKIPSNQTNQTRTEKQKKEDDEAWHIDWEQVLAAVYITLLSFAVIQILCAFLLYVGQVKKSIPILYTWLGISVFSILTNGLFIKIYEMLVVYAYSYKIRIEAHTEALKKLREFPHMCVVTTQLYPGANWEKAKGSALLRKAFYQSKSFVVNKDKDPASSVFTLHKQIKQQQSQLQALPK